MKEQHDTSRLGVQIIVDHTAGVTMAKRVGTKANLSCVPGTSASAYRSALRDAAYYLLVIASATDGANCVRDQIRIMWDEHRMFNERSLK